MTGIDVGAMVERLREGVRAVSTNEFATELYDIDDAETVMAQAADALLSAQEEAAGLRVERDEFRSAWKDAEQRVAEAHRGIDALNDIDAAWDAFGTAGNRKVLTLAEQIASQGRELEAAESKLADAVGVLEPFAAMLEYAVECEHGYYDLVPANSGKWDIRRCDAEAARAFLTSIKETIASPSPDGERQEGGKG